MRIAVAVEIPGGVHEGVHGIGFAARRAATLGTSRIYEFRSSGERRIAFAGQIRIRRQDYRQIFVGNCDHTVFGAINYWDWSAPVALTRDSPVFQAEDGFFFSEALGFRKRGHFFFGLFGQEAGEFAGVDAYSVFGEGFGRWLLRHRRPRREPGVGAPADAASSDRDGATTARMGRLYFLQNSKSRSSCAGTAMMAPVPYSSSTKFPTQMGSFSPVERIHGVTSGEEAFFFRGGHVFGLHRHHFYSRQLFFGLVIEPGSRQAASATTDAWAQESARSRRRWCRCG